MIRNTLQGCVIREHSTGMCDKGTLQGCVIRNTLQGCVIREHSTGMCDKGTLYRDV